LAPGEDKEDQYQKPKVEPTTTTPEVIALRKASKSLILSSPCEGPTKELKEEEEDDDEVEPCDWLQNGLTLCLRESWNFLPKENILTLN